jgi:hypothetical protein
MADDLPVTSAAASAVPTARPADPRRGPRRTLVVWGAFACATAVAVGLLRLGSAGSAHPASHTQASAPAAPLGAPAPAIATAGPRIAPRDTPLDRTRWRSIVIHHSGSPAGDASSIERQHFKQGLVGLGYHFVIGNGQGLDDGQVVVGYRWERQLPGAHVSTLARVGAQRWNDESIAICLVGNGDRHPFTERQLREAAALVRTLQAELGIPAGSVVLHSDIAPVDSPGRCFPAADFRRLLLP